MSGDRRIGLKGTMGHGCTSNKCVRQEKKEVIADKQVLMGCSDKERVNICSEIEEGPKKNTETGWGIKPG